MKQLFVMIKATEISGKVTYYRTTFDIYKGFSIKKHKDEIVNEVINQFNNFIFTKISIRYRIVNRDDKDNEYLYKHVYKIL